MGYAFFDFSAKAPVFFLFVFSGGRSVPLPPRMLFVLVRPAELFHDAVILLRAFFVRHRAVIVAVGAGSHGERDALHPVSDDFSVHDRESALEDRRIRVRQPRLAAEAEV